MKKNNNTVIEYVCPIAEELNLNTESIICTSSEGTGEEDW